MEREALTVNYRPLLLIFGSVLVAKLLRAITTPACSWIVRHVTSLPGNFDRLKSDIIDLKNEIDTISITGDFPTHARLKRRQNAKEVELSNLDRGYRKNIYKRQTLLETVTIIILELMTVGVVLYYRSVPIVTLPEDCLWPASNILHFPTQIPGSIGAPVWAICIRQTLKMFSALLFKK